MARYEKKKDFGLGKATKQEKTTAKKMANMASGKPANTGGKKLSAAMYTWAKTNMSKLKNPTAAQKKIFDKYKAMKAAGDNPANPKPKPAAKKAAKPAVPQSKTGAAVLELGGSNVKKIEPKKKPVKTKPTAKTESKSSAGRRNIQRQVEAQSGSTKLNQRQAEARRRRARRKGASRNLREMLARKYNRD